MEKRKSWIGAAAFLALALLAVAGALVSAKASGQAREEIPALYEPGDVFVAEKEYSWQEDGTERRLQEGDVIGSYQGDR